MLNSVRMPIVCFISMDMPKFLSRLQNETLTIRPTFFYFFVKTLSTKWALGFTLQRHFSAFCMKVVFGVAAENFNYIVLLENLKTNSTFFGVGVLLFNVLNVMEESSCCECFNIVFKLLIILINTLEICLDKVGYELSNVYILDLTSLKNLMVSVVLIWVGFVLFIFDVVFFFFFILNILVDFLLTI